MERIGNSDVYVLPVQEYVGSVLPPSRWARVRVPVPPSANKWLRVGVGRVHRGTRAYGQTSVRPFMRLTQEARDFYDQALFLKLAWQKFRQTPFDSYVRMRFYFFLENMRYDAHNGLKLACDLIEKSGLVTNDNLILPEIMQPVHAKAEPRLLIEFPLDLPS